MSIIGTFNGASIIGLPCDTVVGVTAPSSIEWDGQEVVSVNTSPFTGQQQVYDWAASWFEGTVSFPPMTRWSADNWSSFVLECRGQANVFQIGNPKAALPKGLAQGSPLVHGAGQTGYSLITRGWVANQTSLLLTGDYIQVGYRIYKILHAANADSSGHSTLAVWPNLRDLPSDGTSIVTRKAKGLFRLKNNTGNRTSVNPGSYGMNALQIREAI